VACLGCGGERHRLVRVLADEDGARIVACNACQLVQLEEVPGPEELARLYANGYFEGSETGAGYQGYAGQEREYLATFAADVRRISEFVPTGSVLDVGCGYGYFVRSALAGGYDAYGVDLSADGVREAAKHAPGRVFRGTIDTVEALAGRRFDVVFASHLIEHLTEPRRFLSELVNRLSDRGIVVLVTPNIESLLARVSGSRWVSFKIPEHVAYYTPKTLGQLAEAAGLEVLAVDPAYQYYRLPFLMGRVRELIHPLGRILPPLERTEWLRDRMVRVTSGSLRLIARKASPGART